MKKRLLALLLSASIVFAATPLSVLAATNKWNTNLEGLTSTSNKPAKITYSEKGVTLTRINENDGLAISKTKTAGDFILESDITFTSGNVANLIFGAEKRFADSVTPKLGKTHHIEMMCEDGKLTYIFDGVTIFDQVTDKDRGVSFDGGHIGVMGYNSTFVVNNVMVTTSGEEEIPDDDNPGNPNDRPNDRPNDQPDDPNNGATGDNSKEPSDAPDDSTKPKETPIALIVGIVVTILLAAGAAVAILIFKKKRSA